MECKGKLGEGAYGCVYTPPAPCIGKNRGSSKKKQVGKIFGRSDLALDEKRIMEIVSEIDPKGDFTIPLKHSCKIVPSSSLKLDCTHLQKADGPMTQLVYDYKGVDLCSFMKNETYDILDHLEGILNVARGLVALSRAGYAHRDMKPPNVMMYEGTMFLTDFGLMIPFDRMYDKEQDYVLGFNYEYYPPEFKVYYDLKIANTPLSNITDLKAFLINDVRANYAQSEQVLRLKDIERTVLDLLTTFKTTRLLEATLETNASKVDMFGFGMIFTKMFLRSEKRKQSKKTLKRLYVLFERCVDPNPFTRVDPDDCVKELLILTKLVVK